MGLLKKKIKQFKKKREKAQKNQLRQNYLDYRTSYPLDEKGVLLEARNGKEIDGNVYYILSELILNEEYSEFKLFVTAESPEKARIIDKKIVHIGGNKPVEIVQLGSDEYYKVIATCKYIVCDSTLQNFYIKREGQIYLNLWHGTPFKVMGKKVIHEPHAVGNAQKNFALADYLLYPNEYMMNHMVEDYMISNISQGKALLAGYPRNSAFFEEEHRGDILNKEGLEGKRVYVYMPTYRPSLMGETLNGILEEMDKSLVQGEVMFAKIHPLASDTVDYSKFSRIKPFPNDYETYEFLNVADVLLTDYSSVFYDFAVTGRKIVLYTYDEMEYLSTRGLYEPIDALPFTKVKNMRELMEALRSPKDYDDKDFLEKYCHYDMPKASKLICKIVFEGFTGEDNYKLVPIPDNGKKNVLVFIDDLKAGEKRDKLMEQLEAFAKDVEANYFVTFRRKDLEDHCAELFKLPVGINYFGRAGKPFDSDVMDHLGSLDELNSCLDRYRCFGNMRINDIIVI